MELQPSIELIFLVAGVFLISGFVKGVIGVGLPTVSIALLATIVDLKSAIAILILPALLTNLFQSFNGSAFIKILKRIWTYLLAALVCTWIGGGVLANANSVILSGLLGALLAIYAATSLATIKINLPVRWEPLASPLIGSAAGILTGLTGSFVFPGVIYLQALNLPRNQFIQAMGITFTMASISLGVTIVDHGLTSIKHFYLSTFALVPAIIGMTLGVLVRQKLNDQMFRRIFLISLLIIGFHIIARSVIN